MFLFFQLLSILLLIHSSTCAPRTDKNMNNRLESQYHVSRMESSAGGDFAIGLILALAALIFVGNLVRVFWGCRQTRMARRRAIMARANIISDDLYGRQEVPVEPFAEAKFSNFHGHFAQTSCTVCLDDFSGETVCTQLSCEHLFHPDCIGGWLQRHETCPNCNLKMAKGSVDAFLVSRGPQEQINPAHISIPIVNS